MLNKHFFHIGFVVIVVSCSLLTRDNVFAFSASITTSDSISLDVSSMGNGSSIHEEPINVQSDCRSGYNLAVATPNGSDLYLGGDDAGTATFEAVDGTSALNNSNNINKWGYSLSSSTSSSSVFSPLSENYSILKTPAQTAGDSDIDETFSIYYGIRVDGSVVPGNYRMANNGDIVYYLTMDVSCTQYTVSFDSNGGTGTVSDQYVQVGEPTKLMPSEPLTAPVGATYTDADNIVISGQADKLWTFWGWNTEVDGSGDWYKDREEVQDLIAAGNTITLYAQWKQATLADMTTGTPVGTEKIINHNLMQDMKPEICWNSDVTTAVDAPAVTLLDYRGKVITDNPETSEPPEQYTVSKLPDGLCWMTTNLNLGRDDASGPNDDGTITLTPDDTDLASNTTFILPASTTTSSTSNVARIRTTNNNGTRENGVFYSWRAATANTTVTSPTTSICPTNWDLPTEKQYNNLNSKAGYSSSNQTSVKPSSFLTDGGFTNGATFYQTNYGHLWTSAASTSSSYGARIESNRILVSLTANTTYGGNKYYEKNVRCVASRGLVSAYYDGNTNDGGTTANQINVETNSTNVANNGFTKSGWRFNNWNTMPDGSGESIAAGASISNLNLEPGKSIVLYAQWIPQYTITYVNNCMTYANGNDSCTQTVSDGTSEQKLDLDASGNGSGTLAGYNNWSLAGWKIDGWSTVADNTSGANPEYETNITYAVSGKGAGDGITLYAHWKPTYSIQFDGNGASNINGMGTTNATTGLKSVRFTNVSEGNTIGLLANNYRRAGFGFAGWSTNPNATVSSGDIIYGPMEIINAPAPPSNGTNYVTMYAVWVAAEKDNDDNPIYFQDWNNCDNLTPANFDNETETITGGSVIALTDKRDNQVYAVAKLADGNCWMIENLRLEASGTMGYNMNDSSITNESLSQGYGGTTGVFGNFVGLASSETTSVDNAASNDVYKSSANPPVDTYNLPNGTLEDIGTANNPTNRFPRYNNNNTQNSIDSATYTRNYGNDSSSSGSGTYPSANLYSYGNYYTWSAAMANTNHYVGASSTDSAGKTSEAVGTSLCPTGWHLPSSSSPSKELGFLSQKYGGSGDNQSGAANSGDVMSRRFRAFPNNFLLSHNRGTDGRYWSRTSWNSTNAYYVIITASTWSPSDHLAKNRGFNVRCLINPT